MTKPACPGCAQRDARIAELEKRVAELEAQLRQLSERLNINSTNSSIPPSANPIDAPKPTPKQRSTNKRGAQLGHPPRFRQRLPRERLRQVVDLIPERCQDCQQPLPKDAGDQAPEPSWHQVAELPQAVADVTEYRGHFRTCPCCGKVNHQPIPASVKDHCLGPRLAALLAYLAGSHRLSKRGLEELVEDVFEVPISLGTISRLEGQMADALAAPYEEAQNAVAAAEVKHVDETSWKQAGKKCWLWLAATSTVAVFLIHARRNWQALKALLAENIFGFICSDRWSSYDRLSRFRRQVCWAHLKRDFQKVMDRGGPSRAVGKRALALTKKVFETWHLFRGGTLDRPGLMVAMEPIARAMERLLRRGSGCAEGKTATFCENVLWLWPAVWRFVVSEGVEPTNNHAERMVRRGVLWRKSSFGCQSERGCRFVERMLTVVQTRRLQGKSVFEYLHRAVTAHREGKPAPALVQVG